MSRRRVEPHVELVEMRGQAPTHWVAYIAHLKCDRDSTKRYEKVRRLRSENFEGHSISSSFARPVSMRHLINCLLLALLSACPPYFILFRASHQPCLLPLFETFYHLKASIAH